MAEKGLLNLQEASHFLKKSEKEIKDLVRRGMLPAYQIGGVYLRFKREHLEKIKNSQDYADLENSLHQKGQRKHESNVSLKDKFLDLIYFNDFYILIVLIVIALLMLILRGIL